MCGKKSEGGRGRKGQTHSQTEGVLRKYDTNNENAGSFILKRAAIIKTVRPRTVGYRDSTQMHKQ